MPANSYRHIRVRPMNPTIGALIETVDISQPAAPEVYEEIQQALWRHHVVFFRDQKLTPEAHLALARSFGDPVGHEIFAHLEGYPEISLIENDREHPPEINVWHTDVTFRERPIQVSILHGQVIPPSGGDTMFASQAAAYESLHPAVQRMLLDLEAEHDVLWAYEGFDFLERAGGEAKAAELRRTSPPKVHPVVVKHPVTGRAGIFVNSSFTKRIVGVSKRESQAILAMLFDAIKVPEVQVRFTWEPDSIAIWDNFAVQHYALADYWPEHRLMRRITVGTAKPEAARETLALAAE